MKIRGTQGSSTLEFSPSPMMNPSSSGPQPRRNRTGPQRLIKEEEGAQSEIRTQDSKSHTAEWSRSPGLQRCSRLAIGVACGADRQEEQQGPVCARTRPKDPQRFTVSFPER